ncbi:MAG: hypothetical protein EZS28_020414 [Streblomastix strix]|uniref:SPRY domain-containing protein n=1 Tax=Streblomastix strix TaxID=222440 RepID=A0A5J4VN74_9EUKA|nr:MAG: hypothetical protein EZS28_020414 [Streblomastix strix]
MSVPIEYNVIGGLIGLGPDILLEVLSELRLIPDAIQFIGINKKFMQLKNHSRFYRIIETLNYPIAIHNPDPIDVDFTDIDEVQKMITKIQVKPNTISLTQVLEKGIWSLETTFNTIAIDGCGGVGIVRDSFNIPAGTNPHLSLNNQHMVAYFGKPWCGQVCYKKTQTLGNLDFANNQIVKLEFDSEKGTLIFFVDGIQQPIYIQGIKEKVRFFVFLLYSDSYCTIGSLKQLAAPTSGHIENERSIQWQKI